MKRLLALVSLLGIAALCGPLLRAQQMNVAEYQRKSAKDARKQQKLMKKEAKREKKILKRAAKEQKKSLEAARKNDAKANRHLEHM
jgi:Protein of unknown function (DUF2756)